MFVSSVFKVSSLLHGVSESREHVALVGMYITQNMAAEEIRGQEGGIAQGLSHWLWLHLKEGEGV